MSRDVKIPFKCLTSKSSDVHLILRDQIATKSILLKAFPITKNT